MIWFNVLLTFVIVIFTMGVVAEDDNERVKYYHSVLLLAIVAFTVLNFIRWLD